MKHLNAVRFLSLTLAVAATLALPSVPAGAAQTDISQVPLGTASSTSVLPNLMFILDDSGSMGRQVMPDNVDENNTCKNYRTRTNGSTSTNCALDNNTDLVSPQEDDVRHIPTQPWYVGPPAFAAEFNTIYYNPQITYKPGKDRVGAVMESFGTPWTTVKVNPYLSTNTFDITTQYPEAVFCLNDGDSPTSTTNCRRNGYATDGTTLLASFRYSNASTPADGSYGWPISTAAANFRSVRMRFGGPYYYTILPREHCSDINLTTCVLSSTPTGLNTLPAPVRYCQDSTMANSDAVQSGISGATARCQAKLDGSHANMRYGTFVRVDIVATVPTYSGRPNRTDCAARPVCTYDEEMTNFANWYAYYHTRMQSMKTAAGRVFADMDDRYRIGFVTINASDSTKYLKIDKFEPVHKGNWYDKFYVQVPNSSTPLRLALSRVGRHYAGQTNGINSFMPDDPIQYSCQQNFALLTTDGYWNGPGGEQLDGTTDMDNQDNVTETFVSRPTGTLDGFGTTSVSSNTNRALEQVVCTGSGGSSANFTGTPDGNCGCSGSFKRVKQRTLDDITTTTTVDGVAGSPVPSTSSSFQDITGCDAAEVTSVTPIVEREQVLCTASGAGTANFSGSPDTNCGCAANFKAIKQRTHDRTRTVITTDGVVTSDVTSPNTTTFQTPTACNALVRTRTIVTRETKRVVCAGGGNVPFGDAFGTTPCGCGGTNERVKQRVHDITQVIVTTDGAVTSNTTNHAAGAFTNVAGASPNGTPSGNCVGSGALAGSNGTLVSVNTVPVSDNNPGVSNGGTTITAAMISLAPNPSTVNGTPVVTNNGGTTVTTANYTITPNPTFTTGITSTSTTPGGFANTLADVAMYYYKNDLRTAGALSITKNNVPTTTKDPASHQHMVTFTLGLGLDGLMNYDPLYETAITGDFKQIKDGATGCSWSPGGASAVCNWPEPAQNSPTALDDLWHAAVNGRGLYFSAKDPNSLQGGLAKALDAMKVTTGSAASSATSTPNVTPTDNFIYSSTYRTINWDGEIIAERIDVTDGTVQPGTAWTVGAPLNSRTTATTDTRNIFTFDAGTANKLKSFLYGNLTGSEPGYFDDHCGTLPPSPPPGTAVWPQCGAMSAADLAIANSGTNLVNWLRGQRQHETNYFRARENLMGDTVNAKPAFLARPSLAYGDAVTPDYPSFKAGPAGSRPPVLFIAANDGMLHAFHGGEAVDGGGTELWAYVPRMLMPELYKLAATNYGTNHRYYVDGSPVTMDVFIGGAWKTILVGGLNAGGRGFYALDVTDPTATGVKALWEICADPTLCAVSDPDIGYSYGQAVITKRPSDGKWVVIVSSGYNNVPGTGGGYLYVLDAATGAILSKTGTEVSGVNVGDNVTPSGFAKISGFSTNFAVNNTTSIVYGGDLLGNVWRFDLSTNVLTPDAVTSQRLGRAMDGTGAGAKPQSITTKPEITRFDAGFNVVYVATGRFIGSSDILDPASFLPPLDLAYQQAVYAVKDTGTDLGTLRSAGANLVQQTLIVIDSTSRTITNNAVDWSTQNGWYVDFNPAGESPGERVNIDMQLVRGVLLVETNEPNDDACSSGGNSFFYQFDYRSGSYISSAPGGVVGILQGQALAAGFVVYRLPNGQLKYTGIDVTGKKKTGGVNPGSGGSLGKRVSWRELM